MDFQILFKGKILGCGKNPAEYFAEVEYSLLLPWTRIAHFETVESILNIMLVGTLQILSVQYKLLSSLNSTEN